MSDIRWNYIQLASVSAIRKIDNDRMIVLSPKNFNTAYELSSMLVNRSDKNIAIDVHNYSPMEFTHQGAEWIDESYQKETKIKVIVGEFGVYEKQVSEEDVSQFLSSAVELIKKHNPAWSYWEYNAGFGAYDYNKKRNGSLSLQMHYCND